MPNERPKVGPADPETRKKMLRAELDRSAGGDSRNKKPPVKPAAKRAPPPKKRKTLTLGDALDPKTKRESAHDGETVMDVVDKAVDGAKPDPY